MSGKQLFTACFRLLLPGVLMASLSIGFMAGAQVDDFDLALARALSEHRARPGNPIYYREVGRSVNPDVGSGIVYVEARLQTTHQVIPGLTDVIIAVRPEGMWNIYPPGKPGYAEALAALAPSVRATLDDTPYKILADPALDAAVDLTAYQFPWGEGEWATVTRSFNVHGRGEIDFDISQHDVTAAKDGTIVYVNDSFDINGFGAGAWWYWNVVVIEHSPGEYALYGHLAPDSVPQEIKDACTTDYTQPNCSVPVTAGQVIAAEGNTGFSSNPHLHVEFGQQFGIAPYLDIFDGDGDSNRAEAIHTAYIFAEHNVGFQGYTVDEAAAWQWGVLQQASHRPAPPAGQDLVRNGDFSAGTDGWTPSGQINWDAQDGIMRFLRLNTDEPPAWAIFHQNLDVPAPAHAAFAVVANLGNSSALPKQVMVTLMNSWGRQYGAFSCAFDLPPGAPLQTYTMRGQAPGAWANTRLEFSVNPADSASAALVDDVSAWYLPGMALPEVECSAP